jgi:peroxiredoxin
MTPNRLAGERACCKWICALLAAMGLAGCSEKPAAPPPGTSQPAKPNAERKDDQATKTPAVPAPVQPSPSNDIEDPPVIGTPQEAFNFVRRPLEMPKVLLTEGEAKNSLIKVDDQMPEISLPDVNGKPQQLSKLLGSKLTVVTFWNTSGPFAVEEIGDLGPLVAKRFGHHGVEIVGIVERSSAAAAKGKLKQVGAEFVNLMDTDGKALKQVATAELPRTYLLDTNGKVLWFDLEYSRSTRRDLVRAIQFALLNDK